MNKITIQDERNNLPIQVDKILITQWLPIIGNDAFGLFCRYLAGMLSRNEKDILPHAILEICGLIHMQGNTLIINPTTNLNRRVIANIQRLLEHDPLLSSAPKEQERIRTAINEWLENRE